MVNGKIMGKKGKGRKLESYKENAADDNIKSDV